MTGIHTNEDKNFLKHFFSQRDNETGKKEREIHGVPTQMRRKGAGGRGFVQKMLFFTPPSLLGIFVHTFQPQTKGTGQL